MRMIPGHPTEAFVCGGERVYVTRQQIVTPNAAALLRCRDRNRGRQAILEQVARLRLEEGVSKCQQRVP